MEVFMTIMEMLRQSGVLAVLGMGIVFLFLIILIFCISTMGKRVSAGKTDKNEEIPVAGGSGQTVSQAGAAITAAITAAVNEYQKDNS
jgi:oxaloacetate decarboxylase gamma subunit